jgi:hypothetical protein
MNFSHEIKAEKAQPEKTRELLDKLIDLKGSAFDTR